MKTDSRQNSIRSAIVFQFFKLLHAIDNGILHSKLGVFALKKDYSRPFTYLHLIGSFSEKQNFPTGIYSNKSLPKYQCNPSSA